MIQWFNIFVCLFRWQCDFLWKHKRTAAAGSATFPAGKKVDKLRTDVMRWRITLFCLNNTHCITKPNPNPNRIIALTLLMIGSCIRYFWIIDHWIIDLGIDIPAGRLLDEHADDFRSSTEETMITSVRSANCGN